MTVITLENQILRALVDPEQGAGIMAFFAKKDEACLSLMPDTRQESTGLDRAGFLMIPYSNRIPGESLEAKFSMRVEML